MSVSSGGNTYHEFLLWSNVAIEASTTSMTWWEVGYTIDTTDWLRLTGWTVAVYITCRSQVGLKVTKVKLIQVSTEIKSEKV